MSLEEHAQSPMQRYISFVQSRSVILPLLCIFSLVGYGVYWASESSNQVVTENAYVTGDVIPVTSQTAGSVKYISANDLDYVQQGDVLVTLNAVDAELAMEKAKANLAKSVRLIRGQFYSASQSEATVKIKEADLAKAQSDLERRRSLVDEKIISIEEYKHAEETFRSATAALKAAKDQYSANEAMVDKLSIKDHPDVLSAVAKLHDAYINLLRTQIRAPVSGVVTHRYVQVGQRISTTSTLMSLVDLNHLWVTANFKESQLKNLRIGQAVKLTADPFNDDLHYTGKIVGIDAGTGSAFSLLPSQNATGNWIKVVQRVPVRIQLSPEQLSIHPLRIGLSMKVVVDTSNHDGNALQIQAIHSTFNNATDVFANEEQGVQELVDEIIHANLAGDAEHKQGITHP